AARACARNGRQPRVRDRVGQTDVEIQSEWCSDFVLKELPEAAVLRIDSAQQLAFVEAESERVIGLPRARLPSRFLASEDDRKPIEIGAHTFFQRLIHGATT